MPADLFSRCNLDLIYPPFLAVALEVIAECRRYGSEYWATRGCASFAEQDAKYAQGRTAPGPIVTAARGGSSAHNYGLAFDFTADGDTVTQGLQPFWNSNAYDMLGLKAEKSELVWGGHWTKPDRPHVQWAGYVTGKELEPLRLKYLAAKGTELEKLQAVWKYIDAQAQGAKDAKPTKP